MANLILFRRDSFLKHLKQGVKPDTFSALSNCSLNGYALFPDAVIRKMEDEIAQYETAKHTPQPGPGQGGFTYGYKKLQQNRYHPYSTGWRSQDSSRSSGQAGKDMLAWKGFEGTADPGVGAEVVSVDVVPEAPKTTHSINDNYCVVDPVFECCGWCKRQKHFCQCSSKCILSCCLSCTFCNKCQKAVTKDLYQK